MKDYNVAVRTACFTNHATKQTAVAITVQTNEWDAEDTLSGAGTYARLWLEAVGKVFLILHKTRKHGNLHIKLISGDPNCVKMAQKLEKMYIKLLKRKKEVTPDVIDSIVHAQGQFKSLPNDDLYANVLTLIWNSRCRYDHFVFDVVRADTSMEYKMAKLAATPEVLKKRIPLKSSI